MYIKEDHRPNRRLNVSRVCLFVHSRQVEERLRFYEEGVAPRKNLTVMGEAIAAVKKQMAGEDAEEDGSKKVRACLMKCIQSLSSVCPIKNGQPLYATVRTTCNNLVCVGYCGYLPT